MRICAAVRRSRVLRPSSTCSIVVLLLIGTLHPQSSAAIDWEPQRERARPDLFAWRSDRELLEQLSTVPGARGVDALRINRLALSAALAGEPEPPLWRQWLPLAVSLGAWVLVEALAESPREARWSEVNSFDRTLREDLRASSHSGRDTADTVSDYMLYGTIALWAAERVYAGVQEVQILRQTEPDLSAWQAAGITGGTLLEGVRTDMPWLLWAGVATSGIKAASGRARPKTSDCLALNDGTDCGGRSGNDSFVSGHTSLSATLASLTCTHRMNRLDRTSIDIGICALGGAMAVTSGAMRVVGDEHWTTDVMAGSVAGALFGWVLPNYWPWSPHRSAEPRHLAPRLRLQPMLSQERQGLGLQLRF